MALPAGRLIMHINYCEQGQSLEYACRKAREWGFDGVEFRAGGSGMEAGEYLDRIAAAYERENLKAIHFGGRVQLNNEKKADHLAALFRFYEEALKRFKLTVCNLQTDEAVDVSLPYEEYEKHGSVFLTEEIKARQVEGLREIAAFAQEKGFRFGLETHHGYYHDLPSSALDLVKAVGSPDLGVVFDYGNIIGFAEPPSLQESIGTIGNSLFYAHFKNSLSTGTRHRQRCALGGGDINHRAFLKLLATNGYAGNYCLECPRQGDREFFAREDAAYFRELLAEVSGA